MPNMSLKKNPMPSQAPEVRNQNFQEVALGYSAETAIDEAKQALGGSDIEAIKAAGEKLQEAGYKLAEIVYSDQQDQTAQADQGGDDVVDADYEVVDE